MDCKNCGKELPENSTVCPACGTEHIAEPQVEERKPQGKVMQAVMAVGLCVILLVMMLVVVFSGTGKAKDGKRVVSPLSDMFCVFRKNDIHCRTTFTVNADKAAKSADDVVATVGKYELTNSQLQVFYWIHVREYVKNNGIYDFNYSEPLAEQFYDQQTGLSWEQHFLNIAIESWRRYALLNIRAEEEGIRPAEEVLREVLSESVEEEAKKNGFESADAMVKSRCGSICTKQDYVDYIVLYEGALLYGEEKYGAYVPTITMAQAEAYYDQNKPAFDAFNLKKEKKTLTDVRHMLIRLDDNTTLASSKVEYTAEQWQQCQEKAQSILDKWLEAPTQENFALLAGQYSLDANAGVGGMYAGITKGDSWLVVEDKNALKPVNDWVLNADRESGHHALLKTDYGYHLIYFVNRTVTEGDWYELAVKQLTSEYYNGLIDDASAKNPIKVNYKKIRLAEHTAA